MNCIECCGTHVCLFYLDWLRQNCAYGAISIFDKVRLCFKPKRFFLLFTGRRQQQHQPPPTPTIYSFGVRVFVYFTSPSHPLPLFSHTRNMGCPFLSLLFASLTVSLSSCNHSSSLPLLILASPIFHSFVLPIFVVNPSKIVLYCICGIVNVFLWPPEYASGKG